ncbi:MAG: glycosyltransferase [Myxococcales bacterium]|nr:glycosyltransferase [Myxococcales bacterium]MCB9520745.1 glycosyltransferase [Myxococcales bacterium]
MAVTQESNTVPPDFSIVIPVYNEEGILSASVADLVAKLADSKKLENDTYELILSANGCVDRTVDIARRLREKYPGIVLLQSDEPNYGKALKLGIRAARGKYVVCDEIDLCDVDFYERALYRLREEGYDLVVGSKRLERSFDKRPPYRKLASSVINWLLWFTTGFEGTDTHGLKAFNRERLLAVVDKCVVDRDMFASELVIRAHRMRFRSTEIPLEVIEKRPPSIRLTKRVPVVMRQLATLAWVIRVKNR